MAKGQKKGSKMQALKNAQAQQAAAKVEFKPDMKHVRALVTEVIRELKHAHEGIRAIIVTWKGERPETLEKMKDEVRAQCKAWLKDAGRKINPQSIYNYQSDLIACLNGYQAYSGMSEAQRKKFDAAHKSIGGYHALVKFLRDVKKTKRTVKPVNVAEARIKSEWKNHKKDAMKKTKNYLRFADTDSLLALIDFAEALVSARKKGNVERLRKAA